MTLRHATDIGGTLASVPTDTRPDIVHVVGEIPVANWYRPDVTGLAARGLPKPGPRTWIRNAETSGYVRLTKAVRNVLVPAS